MRSSRSARRSGAGNGFSLTEVLVVCSLIGLTLSIAAPAASELLAQAAIRGACFELVTALTRARGAAVFLGVDVGVKFVPQVGGDFSYALYADGNHNGVLSADIASGKDKLVAGPFSMNRKYPGVTFSFLSWYRGPDPNGDPVGSLSRPVRFGAGSICTFAPTGKASPGSIWLSNGTKRQSIVRVSPETSRIVIWDWRPATRTWVRRW